MEGPIDGKGRSTADEAHARERSAPFAAYLECPWFHKINTAWPGLQLVHELPYIFVAPNFLSEAECASLLELVSAQRMRSQAPHETQVTRTSRDSTACILPSCEMAWLRRRCCELARVTDDQCQPLKVSRYEPGQGFSLHSDAISAAQPGVPTQPVSDSNFDCARAAFGIPGAPLPGVNRMLVRDDLD